MKTFTKAIIALSALAAVAGCAKEQTNDSVISNIDRTIPLSLTAGQEDEDAITRAAVNATDSKVIDWSKGDCLSVFDGVNANCKFTLDDASAGKSVGTFSGKVSQTSAAGYAALYPYQSAASYDGSKISGVVLKSEQTAVPGSFDPEAALMCAKSAKAGESLSFRNLVGFLKFTTTFECKAVTLVSNNANDVLAGTIEVTPGDDPTFSVTSGATHKISLSPATGNLAAGTYYIAILPGTLSKGFKLIFTMTDGSQKYKSSVKSWEFPRKKVNNIKTAFSSDALTPDLSAPESANCYLVKKAGSYAFRTVKGNSDTSVGNVSSVEVLWESFGTSTTPTKGDLIASATVSGEYLEFSTPETFKNGNAVIAAKDADGTILWSWHIWCASEGYNEQVYKNNAGTMMDRNLGATSATPGDVGSLGLFYQWGRKDPFKGTGSINGTVVAKSVDSGTWTAETKTITQELAIKNPMIFYMGTSNFMPFDSWASTKTIYDPCPAGWRVPDGGSNGIWAKASGKAESFAITADATNHGYNFGGTFGSDATIWYPASGYRKQDASSPADVGDTGSYASVTTNAADNQIYALYFVVKNKSANPVGLYGSSHGRSVRCCKIK